MGNPSPKFHDLEKHAGVAHFGPYYRLSSYNVHASVKAILWQYSGLGEGDPLIAGPTNAGLAEPGHHSLVSLLDITRTLLRVAPDARLTNGLEALEHLCDEAGAAFANADAVLKLEEARRRSSI